MLRRRLSRKTRPIQMGIRYGTATRASGATSPSQPLRRILWDSSGAGCDGSVLLHFRRGRWHLDCQAGSKMNLGFVIRWQEIWWTMRLIQLRKAARK